MKGRREPALRFTSVLATLVLLAHCGRGFGLLLGVRHAQTFSGPDEFVDWLPKVSGDQLFAASRVRMAK